MTVYAKQMKNGNVVRLLTYNDCTPIVSEKSGTVLITKEEYDELYAALDAEREQSAVMTDQISDSEALAIITGEVSADDA